MNQYRSQPPSLEECIQIARNSAIQGKVEVMDKFIRIVREKQNLDSPFEGSLIGIEQLGLINGYQRVISDAHNAAIRGSITYTQTSLNLAKNYYSRLNRDNNSSQFDEIRNPRFFEESLINKAYRNAIPELLQNLDSALKSGKSPASILSLLNIYSKKTNTTNQVHTLILSLYLQNNQTFNPKLL